MKCLETFNIKLTFRRVRSQTFESWNSFKQFIEYLKRKVFLSAYDFLTARISNARSLCGTCPSPLSFKKVKLIKELENLSV